MNGKKTATYILIAVLAFMILCPLISIFAEAIFSIYKESAEFLFITFTDLVIALCFSNTAKTAKILWEYLNIF